MSWPYRKNFELDTSRKLTRGDRLSRLYSMGRVYIRSWPRFLPHDHFVSHVYTYFIMLQAGKTHIQPVIKLLFYSFPLLHQIICRVLILSKWKKVCLSEQSHMFDLAIKINSILAPNI